MWWPHFVHVNFGLTQFITSRINKGVTNTNFIYLPCLCSCHQRRSQLGSNQRLSRVSHTVGGHKSFNQAEIGSCPPLVVAKVKQQRIGTQCCRHKSWLTESGESKKRGSFCVFLLPPFPCFKKVDSDGEEMSTAIIIRS